MPVLAVIEYLLMGLFLRAMGPGRMRPYMRVFSLK
jgi:hypothetical protein